jgi:hypothetical protein
MQRSDIESSLTSEYPAEVVNLLLGNYLSAIGEYRKENWKYVGNEIGQFVECSRRMIEYKITGQYTPLTVKLAIFNEKILNQWENSPTTIPEEYRIIIPRIIYAMYCIRNKRGMIHKNQIDPNRMDATVLLSNTKWVLAEFFRLTSNKTFNETIDIIDSIISKETSVVWDNGTLLRILDTKMSCANQILCLLYLKNNQTDKDLLKAIEYSNPSRFKGILYTLHKLREIEFSSSICTISPKGIQKAELILNKN